MRVGQAGGELLVKGVVDALPQREAGLPPLGEVLGRDEPRGARLELVLDVAGEARPEGAQAVYRAGDAVEGDALEPDLADELGCRDGGEGAVGLCGLVGGCCLEGC